MGHTLVLCVASFTAPGRDGHCHSLTVTDTASHWAYSTGKVPSNVRLRPPAHSQNVNN